MNFIEVKNAVFSYDEESGEVLKDFSINIEKGSFVAILGHNGSGKSTLAKLFNGLNLPDSGKVLVDGMDTADETKALEIRNKVGLVFQNPDNQIVATIVEEDVAFGPENLGLPREEIRKRVDESLKAVGMTEYMHHEPHRLSGGQKQRVAIAGIIAMQPECVIFDEPTAMLDPRGRKDVMNIISKLNKEMNKTVVLITHYMDEAAKADRVVVIDSGKIIADGKPHDVFNKVELLKGVGLDVPQPTELIFKLQKAGITFDRSVLHTDECVEAISRALED
ncbi:MAG: energy-coupling factor transporter ATPase [Acutalibacteraceae bacterium]|nr:energy-coupling factor transporter ATPase [Acutalibacteraceae bacterium]